MKKRSEFPVGSTVQYVESGQKAEVVSIKEHDDDHYENPWEVCVKFNGMVVKSDAEDLKYR